LYIAVKVQSDVSLYSALKVQSDVNGQLYIAISINLPIEKKLFLYLID